jgi:hypothetical protein
MFNFSAAGISWFWACLINSGIKCKIWEEKQFSHRFIKWGMFTVEEVEILESNWLFLHPHFLDSDSKPKLEWTLDIELKVAQLA